jgi:hypothetical protein
MGSLNSDLVFGVLSVSSPMSATEISARTKLSQPTISRALSEIAIEHDEFVSYRNGRSVFYAIARQIHPLPLRIPIFKGEFRYGELMAVNGGFLFFPPNARPVYSASLPWFMRDMRPQGYIGRAFCRANAHRLNLSARLRDWTDDDVLRAFSQSSLDAPGDISVGKQRDRSLLPVVNDVPSYYDQLSCESLSGEQPGSSAGGEQPKFAIAYTDADGRDRHVIVKFSPATGNPVSERWADLLIAEHIANEVLRENGIDASCSRIIRTDTRIYLESERFDRSNDGHGVVSFAVIDDEFIGSRRSWSISAVKLHQSGLLDAASADHIATVESFGQMIANSDMHFGNMSFFWLSGDDGLSLRLAPIYDMLPMLYAPENSEIVSREFNPPDINNKEACRMAREFWQRVASHDMISHHFSSIAGDNLKKIPAEQIGSHIRYG